MRRSWSASRACSPGTGRADRCEDEGRPFVLGPALSRRAIHGGTAHNDRMDAHKMAALLRGGLSPHADVDPRRMRATRDLWRRSNHLRHKRAELYAHLQHTARQDHRSEPLGRLAKPQHRRGLSARFDHGCVPQNMAVDTARSDCDEPWLAALERSRETTAHRHEPVAWALLRPMPGGGTIRALVMRDAREDIARFPRGQAFVSACRWVTSARESHGKRYGTSGTKIGNAQLTGACSEAAVLVLKHNEPAQKSLTQLAHRQGTGKALSILAHTLGRAVSCMLTQPVAFDPEKFLAPEGWRERTRLASHGSPRGKRHHPRRLAPRDHARGP